MTARARRKRNTRKQCLRDLAATCVRFYKQRCGRTESRVAPSVGRRPPSSIFGLRIISGPHCPVDATVCRRRSVRLRSVGCREACRGPGGSRPRSAVRFGARRQLAATGRVECLASPSRTRHSAATTDREFESGSRLADDDRCRESIAASVLIPRTRVPRGGRKDDPTELNDCRLMVECRRQIVTGRSARGYSR